jgi:hypothetical protein
MFQSLAIVLVVKQLAMSLVDVIVPIIKVRLAQNKLNEAFAKDFKDKPTEQERLDLQLFVENQAILQTQSEIYASKYLALVM